MIKTDILRNGYKILQDSERFQFGIDAVLLADFASKALKGKENVIDLGTGTGIIPLLCRRKSKGSPEQPVGMPGRKQRRARQIRQADLFRIILFDVILHPLDFTKRNVVSANWKFCVFSRKQPHKKICSLREFSG